MNILLFDMGSFTFEDLREALLLKGHNVKPIYYHFDNKYEDGFFEERFRIELSRESFDCVFSINFFPLIALACKDKGIPYVSWSYDSPLEEGFSNYFNMETNYIFLFDRAEVEEYGKRGFDRVFHMPLAVNVGRLKSLSFDNDLCRKYEADISFVGKIYESSLDVLLYPADEYVKGYIDSLIQAQMQVYGCNFLEKSLSDELINSLNQSYQNMGQNNLRLNKKGLAYAISTHITHFERAILLEELAERYIVKSYSFNNDLLSDNVIKCGPVKYRTDMNAVFMNSRINLCPTLRSIASGIPLRALDILGSGSVLMSNYQAELAEWFVDGEDLIMYGSLDEAIDKVEYYLSDEKADLLFDMRKKAQDKVEKYFNYSSALDDIISNIRRK